MPTLFDPVQLGELSLSNRVVMAPLTRCRASEGRVPNDLMLEYYVQRANAGLILTEATAITPMGVGYPDTPGIWSDEQITAWRKITDAVHNAGSNMVVQLWHVGRISDPVYLNGELPVAPSAIQPAGHVNLLYPHKPFETPRALAMTEIPGIVEAYRQAAINAKAAGFDGVELHAANGYLIDQFLQSSTNQRTDGYGGSVENRARLLLEVTDVLVDVWGAGRVGVHLAPRGDTNDMGDANPAETFGYVMQQLDQRGIAFVFVREHQQAPGLLPQLRQLFRGALIANEQLDQAAAETLLQQGVADAVSFGKLYIANPDLVQRFQQKAALNPLVPETIYAQGASGYTDYPAMAQ